MEDHDQVLEPLSYFLTKEGIDGYCIMGRWMWYDTVNPPSKRDIIELAIRKQYFKIRKEKALDFSFPLEQKEIERTTQTTKINRDVKELLMFVKGWMAQKKKADIGIGEVVNFCIIETSKLYDDPKTIKKP